MVLKYKLFFFLLLMALPAELSAVSDDAKVLMNRQFALYDTDSVDAFKLLQKAPLHASIGAC